MADPVRDFRGTEDGEWAIVNGDFDVVAGAEAVPQGIRVRVGTFLAECLLDNAKGVDYVDTVLVKGADPLVVRAIIEERIADSPDITNVVGAELREDPETREASIDYIVDTVYGDEPLSESVGVP